MIKAVYALSADPITFGHIDIIERASKIYDKLVVAIGDNPSKKYLFEKNERLEMAEKALSSLNNVEVKSFSGLLVDFAHINNINVIVRGIRNVKDLEDENTLFQINSNLDSEIETSLLFTKPSLSKVSSSAVKAIQKEYGSVADYTTLNVKEAVEKRMCDYLLVGVTGLMGSGKSWVAEQLVEYSKTQDVQVHNIELDDVAKDILYYSEQANHLSIREKLEIRMGTLDKKIIASKIFGNDPESKENLEFVNNLVRKPLEVQLREILKTKKGIILINSAILIESNMLNYVNNNLIYVDVDDKQRFEMLEKYRGYTPEQAKSRISSVLTKDAKIAIYDNSNSNEHGKFLMFKNDENVENKDELIMNLYKELLKAYNK
jgi:pantetheine-phosphate adenylyltransferase